MTDIDKKIAMINIDTRITQVLVLADEMRRTLSEVEDQLSTLKSLRLHGARKHIDAAITLIQNFQREDIA